MFQIVSAGGDVLAKGYSSFDDAETQRLSLGRIFPAYNFATVEQVGA